MSAGERDLAKLLASLEPGLAHERYSFEVVDHPEFGADIFALVRELEGVTAIRISAGGAWARISLGVHSCLETVGLTAALSRALADAGIGANVIAALHHDHIFVPWERREAALRVLSELGG